MNNPSGSGRHRFLFAGLLSLVLASFAIGATAFAAGNDGTIASKLEEQGQVNNLKVTDLRATKKDNLLHIQAEITNVSPSNQQLYYRFKWLDADGFTVWDEEPWKPMIFYGNQKQMIRVGSPSFKATDFRLVLQSPN